MGRELTLRKALRDVEAPYDVVLIDCPPALGLLTVNALVAADHALLSAEAQYFAMQGVEQALEVIELARDGLNPDLDWLGVFFNIADMRTVHSREAYASLREHLGDDKVFDDDDPLVDRLRGLRRAGGLDPRVPPGPGRRLPAARRRAAAAPRADRRPARGSSRTCAGSRLAASARAGRQPPARSRARGRPGTRTGTRSDLGPARGLGRAARRRPPPVCS